MLLSVRRQLLVVCMCASVTAQTQVTVTNPMLTFVNGSSYTYTHTVTITVPNASQVQVQGGSNCSTPGHHSVLWSGGEYGDVWVACLLFSAIVLFTIVWENGTHYFERNSKDHHAYMHLLQKLYKELTLMGIISFTLFIVLDVGLLTNSSIIVSFEFAHYLIFFMALFFVLLALLSMRSSLDAKNQWDTIAVSPHTDICGDYRKQQEWFTSTYWHRFWFVTLGLKKLYLPVCESQQNIEWCLMRLLFLREYEIEVNFDFSKYARKTLTRAIVKSVEIRPSTWMCLVVYLVMCAILDISGSGGIVAPTGGSSAHRRLGGDASAATGATGTGGTVATILSAKLTAHLTVIILTSWLSCLLQVAVFVLLRQAQRELLQQKLCMHDWSGSLTRKLMEQISRTQAELQEEEDHDETVGSTKHLKRLSGGITPHETGEMGGLSLDGHGHAYDKPFADRLLWLTDINHMWVCFALAYYTLDLGVMLTQSSSDTLGAIIIHFSFLFPHVALVFFLMPATLRHESLLSCVVRKNDIEVESVKSKMNLGETKMKELRRELIHNYESDGLMVMDQGLMVGAAVPAVKKEQEVKMERSRSAVQPGTGRNRGRSAHGEDLRPKANDGRLVRGRSMHGEAMRPSIAQAQAQHVSVKDFSTEDLEVELAIRKANLRRYGRSKQAVATLNVAARTFFRKLSQHQEQTDSETAISVMHLRTGLRGINVFYSKKEWATMMRLMDRDHSHSISQGEFVAVLQPNMGHWRDKKRTTIQDIVHPLAAALRLSKYAKKWMRTVVQPESPQSQKSGEPGKNSDSSTSTHGEPTTSGRMKRSRTKSFIGALAATKLDTEVLEDEGGDALHAMGISGCSMIIGKDMEEGLVPIQEMVPPQAPEPDAGDDDASWASINQASSRQAPPSSDDDDAASPEVATMAAAAEQPAEHGISISFTPARGASPSPRTTSPGPQRSVAANNVPPSR